MTAATTTMNMNAKIEKTFGKPATFICDTQKSCACPKWRDGNDQGLGFRPDGSFFARNAGSPTT